MENILNLLRKITPRPILILYHHFLAFLGALFYNFPSRNFITIGVTGTDGKTTTATLIAHLLETVSFKVGLSTTTEHKIGNQVLPKKTRRTTPGRLALQKILRQMANQKVDYGVIETTSHALSQGRHLFVYYDIACLTNISHEHLDYHGTFENYRKAKGKLFYALNNSCNKGQKKTSVLNRDDPSFDYFSQIKTEAQITYGIDNQADIMAYKIESSPFSSKFKVKTPKGEFEVNFPLPARHNIYNALAAIAVGVACGLSLEEIKKGLESFKGVPGRLEKVQAHLLKRPVSKNEDISVIVDYAHTPNSLEKILKSLKEILPKEKHLITVFGCGGDRDKEKRPQMGKIASEISDYVIITSDNPRSEEPIEIINEILKGIPENPKATIDVEVDRKSAIFKAIKSAHSGDIVLIAGKGHETYQIFKDKTIHFDDREVALEALEAR